MNIHPTNCCLTKNDAYQWRANVWRGGVTRGARHWGSWGESCRWRRQWWRDGKWPSHPPSVNCLHRCGSDGWPQGRRRQSCACGSAALTPLQGQTLCGSSSTRNNQQRRHKSACMTAVGREKFVNSVTSILQKLENRNFKTEEYMLSD